ncbi:hypothetical protein HDU76_012252 [Blyttiomyces sp. JEL0837]|nr:hypothetical protein HDU76_012252 [Blyttiomyces sp. JEL0837]
MRIQELLQQHQHQQMPTQQYQPQQQQQQQQYCQHPHQQQQMTMEQSQRNDRGALIAPGNGIYINSQRPSIQSGATMINEYPSPPLLNCAPPSPKSDRGYAMPPSAFNMSQIQQTRPQQPAPPTSDNQSHLQVHSSNDFTLARLISRSSSSNLASNNTSATNSQAPSPVPSPLVPRSTPNAATVNDIATHMAYQQMSSLFASSIALAPPNQPLQSTPMEIPSLNPSHHHMVPPPPRTMVATMYQPYQPVVHQDAPYPHQQQQQHQQQQHQVRHVSPTPSLASEASSSSSASTSSASAPAHMIRQQQPALSSSPNDGPLSSPRVMQRRIRGPSQSRPQFVPPQPAAVTLINPSSTAITNSMNTARVITSPTTTGSKEVSPTSTYGVADLISKSVASPPPVPQPAQHIQHGHHPYQQSPKPRRSSAMMIPSTNTLSLQTQSQQSNKDMTTPSPQTGDDDSNSNDDTEHNSSNGGKSQRTFTCPFPDCGMVFTRRQNMACHATTHSGEKPHACDVPGCSSRFRRRQDLYRHSRSVHLAVGTRQYFCEKCGMKFARADGLAAHLKSCDG